jgi:glycopeptide antibiotics resistance protein
MHQSNTIFHLSKTELKQFIKQWTPLLVTASILLVLATTLFPFNFSFEQGISLGLIVKGFYHPSDLGDCVRNVFLFIPFGFGLACCLPGKRLSGLSGLLLILAASSALSLTVETLQIFLPMRSSSLYDLVTNTSGGGVGFACAYWLRFPVFALTRTAISKSQQFCSVKVLTAGFIGYFALMCLAAISLQNATNFSNWDENFSLWMGNEPGENNIWLGEIKRLDIADRALSKQEVAQIFSRSDSWDSFGNSLVASYHLDEKTGFLDRTGNLPKLRWQGKSYQGESELGVLFAGEGWLKTEAPASAIAQRLRATSQFTIDTVVKAADPLQLGPMSIISFSPDRYPALRNFVLAQDTTDLVFGLRSPVTGQNGTYPLLVVPDVFLDLKPYHIVVTYDGLALWFYIDNAEKVYSLALSPNITFFRYLLYFWDGFTIRLDATKAAYKILYYALIFVPLGATMGTILKSYKIRFPLNILLILSIVTFPPIILEGVSIKGNSMNMSLENIIVGWSILAISFLLVRWVSLPHLKQV